MQISANSRWAIGLLGLAAVFMALVYVLPAVSASTEEAKGKCIKPQQKLVDGGENPSGHRWTITATVRNNGNCDSWLFESRFVPASKPAGSFSFAWRIPTGGHLSDGFTIGARDEVSNSERVFGGVVNSRVSRIAVQMSNGEPLVVRPKLPTRELRERFVWLRNIRYAMRFYPAGSHAIKATLYSVDGKVVDQLDPLEGEFVGPGV